MPLLAYHNDPAIKADRLAQVRAHRAADQIIKGHYWEDGKGCAVGCTIHGSDHDRYETELGVPQMLAHLEDRIFEGLPNGRALDWPEQFLAAITPGHDLSRVGPQFLVAVLERRLAALGPEAWGVRGAIEQVLVVVRLWAATGAVDAASAASADSAAWNAASAAESAARSAESAAWSAASAAESAAESAARSAARSAERSAEYEWMADTLLDLLSAA